MADEQVSGATLVITHRVRKDKHPEYERWLEEIGPLARSAKGLIDWQIVKPVAGISETYSVILRFALRAQLDAWVDSKERHQLIARVTPLLLGEDKFFIRSGLDFWFTPEGAAAKVPVRWKQFLATWSAIFPLSLVVPTVMLPILRKVGVPPFRPIDSLLVSGAVVALMVYLVMPNYTKLIRGWLFR